MPVIIWFDDGLKNTYDIALPIMEEYGFKGVESVITGYVGKVWPDIHGDGSLALLPCMTAPEIMNLQKKGWDIVSHSVSHPLFPRLTPREASAELVNSHRWIAKNLKKPPLCFVYPKGAVAYRRMALFLYQYIRTMKVGTWHGLQRSIPINNVLEYGYGSSYAIFLFHSILYGGKAYDHTPGQFRSILNAIEESGLEVVTLREALHRSPSISKIPVVRFVSTIFQRVTGGLLGRIL